MCSSRLCIHTYTWTVKMACKSVLVCFGEHKRPVTFSSDPSFERKNLEEAIIDKFDNVIEGSRKPGRSLLLQTKSEGWGGEFVDLPDDAQLPDSSVVRAIIWEPRVSIYI